MLRADLLQQLYLLPRPVRDVVSDAAAQGCSATNSSQGTFAWVLHRQSLLVWKAEDGAAATVRRLTLPEVPVGSTFVEVVPQRHSSALTVIVCTGSGVLHVWLDATFGGQPHTQALIIAGDSSSSDDLICALTATSADAGTSPGFLAVVATCDGALHLYHGSQNGIFPRQFHNPSSSTGAQGVLQAAAALYASTKKAAVDYKFLDGIPYMRTSPSSTPAVQLQLLQLDGSRWKLLVLTSDALDCWLLGTLSGQQSTESLLWSLSIYQAVLGRQRVDDSRVLGFTASTVPAQQHTPQPAQDSTPSTPNGRVAYSARPSTELIYVWSANLLADAASRYQHTVSAFAVEDSPNKGPRMVASQICSSAAALLRPTRAPYGWQLLAHAQRPSCLMLAPNGVLQEWMRTGAELPQVLSSSDSNVAIAASGRSSNWQVLNKEYGLLELSAQDSQTAAGQQAVESVKALLSRVVDMMQKGYAEGCPYRELATGLADCLAAKGMLDSQEGWALLLQTSSSIVDSLPRAGTLGLASLKSMLQDKQARHSLFMVALQVGGVLQRLPANELAALFEHAQMLAAAACVLDYQRDCGEAASGRDAAVQVDRLQAEASQRAIEAAGSLAAAGAGETTAAAEQLHEVFFGRPTVSVPALFQAVAGQARAIRHAAAGSAGEVAGGAQALLHQLLGLCGILTAACEAAQGAQQSLRHNAFNQVTQAEAAGPGWLASEGPRAAWSELSEACLLVLPQLPELPQQQQLAHQAHLPALSQLLSALQATLNAAADPPAELSLAYRELPWRHGQQLLVIAVAELPVLSSRGVLELSLDSGVGGSGDVLSLMPGLREALVWHLQSLAQQHRCWDLLYATCEVMQRIHPLLEDQLQQQMQLECAASGPTLPSNGFTFFVMQRWHSEHRVVDLLQLGREGFTPQLQAYLANTPDLLWMSQVQAKQYADATSSLTAAAAAASAADAQRLWCLSKLSAKAAGKKIGNGQQQLYTATARLRQLQLQGDLMPGRMGGQRPMLAEELAAAAIRVAGQGAVAEGSDQDPRGICGAEAAVAAVEILALEAGSNDTRSYRDLWQHSWVAALKCTPLQELAAERAASAEGAWEAGGYQDGVRHSALFQAFMASGTALKSAAAVLPDVHPFARLQQVVQGLQEQIQDASQCQVVEELSTDALKTLGLVRS